MKSMADKAETVYLAIKDMKGSVLARRVCCRWWVPSDKSILYLVTFVSSRS